MWVFYDSRKNRARLKLVDHCLMLMLRLVGVRMLEGLRIGICALVFLFARQANGHSCATPLNDNFSVV